jgi:hypothetical protein
MRTIILMLPTNFDGTPIAAVSFIPAVRDGVLYLWPRADTGGVGGTNIINGITNINGQTALVQTFSTSMAGTDFAIVSAGGVHTFQLPSASASTRGALSSADWSTFNNKASVSYVDLAASNRVTVAAGTNATVTTNSAGGVMTYTVAGTVSSNQVANIASNRVTVSAGANITVTPSGSGGVMDYAVASTGGGTPGGGVASVQVNIGGAFFGTNGANTKFIYDITNNVLRIVGQLPRIILEDNTVLVTNEIGTTYTFTPNSAYVILTANNTVKVLGSGISVTNIIGLNEKSVASVVELDANLCQLYSITNRATGNMTLVFTNTSAGQKIEVAMLGEAASGSARTITLVPQLGHLIEDGDVFGTALATTSSFTLTNGNGARIKWEVARLNGTNTAIKEVRQFAF